MDVAWCICGAGRGAPQPVAPLPGSIADRLRQLRRNSKRSIADIAGASGVSRQHLWRIEQGLVRNPSPDILEKIGAAYGLGLHQLLGQALPAGREATLLRLMQVAERLSEEEWRQLDDMAKRATAPRTVPPRVAAA